MLTSKAFIYGTIAFSIFSIYAIFYSLYMTQLKFEDSSELNFASQDNSPWFEHKVKVVMVIVDGLRFDYLLNYENIDHEEAFKVLKFNKFNEAYFANPDRYVILRAFADLPTMTVLRVPCLMTGNVPRLGSVLTAFGALPSIEDNIPRQIFLQGKKSYFTGDPILKEYFPKYFESEVQMSGFNLKDKDADIPSQNYLNKKLTENKFDFLVAHFLRLDHMSHNVGLYKIDVKEAIEDIDQFLVHMMNSIDDNTMLIFGGDHGMTAGGDHGGGSLQETNTALVAYHKKGFMKNRHKNNPQISKLMKSINETDDQVLQIDIVPTLSMLMGLPTPFSNMGQILNDLYPDGDYLSQQDCPEAAFEMQMLKDNRLNSLQVWNYFKKYHEGQALFTKQEFMKISNLFDEVNAGYSATQAMIDQSQQCEAKFHEAAISAILKSREFAYQVHDLVSTKPPHDLVVFWQAFGLLILVAAGQVLLVQYVYKTKDYEHISWNLPTDLKAFGKTVAPLAIFLVVVWIVMLMQSPLLMRPITASVLGFAVWIIVTSIISFNSKHRHEEISDNSSTNATEETDQQPRSSLGSFFLFQSRTALIGATLLIAFLFYLTHIFLLDKFFVVQFAWSNGPCFIFMLIAARIAGRYLKLTPYLLVAAFLLAKFFDLISFGFFWSNDFFQIMAFVLLGDWLWGEMQFLMNRLKVGKVWGFHYAACFTTLIFYHYILTSLNNDFVQIYLPRLVWFLTIGSCLASFALRMPRRFIKRNFQINLVLFLSLMQLHRKFVYFTIILSVMRILAYLFKKVEFKNYLHPLTLGLLSYTGLFSLGFQDQKLPRNFEPAFIGIRDFQLGVCLFLYSSSFYSTIILGMLFMSFYSQDLETQEVDLGNEKEESSDCQAVALQGNSNIIKRRNILLYSFFYSLLMLGAAINPVVLKDRKQVYLSMERFLVDSAFFIFTIGAVNCFV